MTFPITADDFGLHPQATTAILDLIRRQKLQRVSVLVNMPSSMAALQECHQYPQVKWGVHLNLVDGKPLSPQAEISTLVDRGGNFHSLPQLLLRTMLHQINFNEVEREFSRQIATLKHYTSIEHLNSHQNIHLFGPYWDIAIKLAQNNNIPHIRQASSVERRLRRFPFKYLVYKILMLYFWQNRVPKSSTFEETSIHPGTNYD